MIVWTQSCFYVSRIQEVPLYELWEMKYIWILPHYVRWQCFRYKTSFPRRKFESVLRHFKGKRNKYRINWFVPVAVESSEPVSADSLNSCLFFNDVSSLSHSELRTCKDRWAIFVFDGIHILYYSVN